MKVNTLKVGIDGLRWSRGYDPSSHCREHGFLHPWSRNDLMSGHTHKKKVDSLKLK